MICRSPSSQTKQAKLSFKQHFIGKPVPAFLGSKRNYLSFLHDMFWVYIWPVATVTPWLEGPDLSYLRWGPGNTFILFDEYSY